MNIICTNDICHVSSELIQETMDSLLKNKEPIVPKFIITYGPPGSGKTTMLNRAIYNNQIKIENTVEVNVDSVISDFDQYKQDLAQVRSLIENNKKFEARRAAIEAYHKYRKTGATFSDFILNTALLNRYNVIWETTGNSIQWTLKEIERIRRYGYKIIIVYPFVDTEQLEKRVEARSWGELRFLDSEYVKRVSTAAQRNFVELAKNADEAYLYNNNTLMTDWKPLVEITNSLVSTNVKCNIPALKDLEPKMTSVLATNLMNLCTKQ